MVGPAVIVRCALLSFGFCMVTTVQRRYPASVQNGFRAPASQGKTLDSYTLAC